MNRYLKIGGLVAVVALGAGLGWKLTRPDPSANPIRAFGGNAPTADDIKVMVVG